MQTNISKQSIRKAFTLIELLIVMSILVVIAALGMPGLLRMNARSQIDSAAKELQSELNLTRLEAMKSGEPLVFRFQFGTGNYEILSKQEYDRISPQRFSTQSRFNNESAAISGNTLSGDAIFGDTSGVDPLNIETMNAEQDDVVGSISPSLGDYGTTSLADTLAAAPPTSLADYGTPPSLGDLGEASSLGNLGDAPSLGDMGDAPSVADRFAQPSSTQQIAALPVSKFLPKRKELPNDLIFTDIVFNAELQQNIPLGISQNVPTNFQQNFSQPNEFQQNEFQQDEFQQNFSQQNGFQQNFSLQNGWSEPIFFFPNGRTSNAHFAVRTTGRYNYFVDISVRGLTGTARIGNVDVW
jgi:prepilin-type N-terminal cleavage/methylation domain-containing protein